MTRYVTCEGATTEESYSKGIESIVFHQLIFFRESVHWYGSRYRMRADDRDEAVRIYVDWTPNCRFLLVPCRLLDTILGPCPVSVVGLASDHLKEMKGAT